LGDAEKGLYHDGKLQGCYFSGEMYSYLSLQDRRDLADKAVVGADLNQFRPEFEF